MRSISTDIEIEASAARVWDVLIDLDRYAQWNPLVCDASGTVVQGGRLRLLIVPPGLAQRRTEVTVLTVIPEKEFRWLGRLLAPRILDGDHRFLIKPLAPGRVRVIQSEDFSGLLVPFVAPWLIANMRRGFEALNVALKRHVEP